MLPIPTMRTRPIAPCDDCSHVSSCAKSGQTCDAYNRFLIGFKWQKLKREPNELSTQMANVNPRKNGRMVEAED